jgi:serine/threonine protein kinase
MIGSFGEVLVLDWGVAKIRDDPRSSAFQSQTAEGTVIGTQRFMSPEQARGEIDQLDERSDIYALGAVLHFLLNDQPKVTKAARAITSKAMSNEKANRYATASDLSADIARLLDAEPVTAYRENAFERTSRWVGKNRFLVLLVLAYLLMRIFLIFTSRS